MSKWMLVLCGVSTIALGAKMDANEVMKRNDEAKKLASVEAQGVLVSGARTKRFTWWRKLDSDGVHYKLLTRFHFPPEVKGEGILFLEHEGSDPDVLMYLPAYKKIRRVESSAQSGSFMSSEFSYTDVLGGPVNDFKYTWKKEEACGAFTCHVIESVPANDAVKARSGYERRLDWVRQDNFMIAASEYYRGDKLIKKLKTDKVVEVDSAKHKWMAQKLEMQNVVSNKSTTIEFSEVKVQDVADSVFTPRNLEKGN